MISAPQVLLVINPKLLLPHAMERKKQQGFGKEWISSRNAELVQVSSVVT
jgi:hypothetical protein